MFFFPFFFDKLTDAMEGQSSKPIRVVYARTHKIVRQQQGVFLAGMLLLLKSFEPFLLLISHICYPAGPTPESGTMTSKSWRRPLIKRLVEDPRYPPPHKQKILG